MNKIRKILVVVALLCIFLTFAACNVPDNSAEINREKVTQNFVELSLGRVNSDFKMNMSDDEILALKDPHQYVIAKNVVMFLGVVLDSTKIRVQKISRLNNLIWSESEHNLFEKSESRRTFDDLADLFVVLDESGWTPDDFSDFVYAVIHGMFDFSIDYCVAANSELTRLGAKVKASDAAMLEKFAQSITTTQDYCEIVKELTKPDQNTLASVENSEQAFKTMIGAITKTLLMVKSNSIFEAVEKVETDTVKAAELSGYVGGMKTNIREITKSFSQDEMMEISSAVLVVEKLLDGVSSYVPGMNIISQVSGVLSVAVHMIGYAGEFLSNGLDVVDTAFSQDVLDLKKGDYAACSAAVLVARMIKGAVATHDKNSLKTLIDEYRQSLGNDTYALKRHMFGLVIVGSGSIFDEENENDFINKTDSDKLGAVTKLDMELAGFKYQYNTLKREKSKAGADQQKVDDLELVVSQLAESLITKATTLSGESYDLSAYYPLSEQWAQKVREITQTAIDQCVKVLMVKIVNAYKCAVDNFFDIKLAKINELIEMGMQTEESDHFERMKELDNELGFSYIYEHIFDMLF